jgi:hypothetical protein
VPAGTGVDENLDLSPANLLVLRKILPPEGAIEDDRVAGPQGPGRRFPRGRFEGPAAERAAAPAVCGAEPFASRIAASAILSPLFSLSESRT